MKIRATTEFIRFRRHSGDIAEPAVKYLRRGSGKGSYADRAEISPEAMTRSLEARRSSLVKAVRRHSVEIEELVEKMEAREDALRLACLEELRGNIRSGAYDFDSPEALRSAVDALIR
ncbi:MAG: hypothetical protein JW838_14285 [Spirochaetes bacterium]|nr:hypothetical protein [Spirochaetota bacterium]